MDDDDDYRSKTAVNPFLTDSDNDSTSYELVLDVDVDGALNDEKDIRSVILNARNKQNGYFCNLL